MMPLESSAPTPAPFGFKLPWDTAFWRTGIARLDDDVLRHHTVNDIVQWCRAERIACAFLLVDVDDIDTQARASDGPFYLVDTRVTLVRDQRPDDRSTDPVLLSGVHPSAPGDLPRLRTIARGSHRVSRFYADDRFPNERCHDLYEAWIERSCHGGAAVVLVADSQGLPAGYVSCERPVSGAGRIGLFAVDSAVRGCGFGGRLLLSAIRWFTARQVQDISLVTQGCNDAALRMYQRHGFVEARRQHWYHLWTEPART